MHDDTSRTDREFAESQALVVHELRAPLTVVRGYLDLLRRPMGDADRLRAIASAQRATERLDTMLDDLLATMAGRDLFSPYQTEFVPLRFLAEDIAEELRPLGDYSISVTGENCSVLGELGRLRQAIFNLVSNAMKHTPSDGMVAVMITCDAKEAVLSVEDDGPGVSPEDRERIFGLFERVTAGRSMPAGLGLGLPVARTIIEAHGGTVALEDPVELAGARFVVRMPVAY
ncbi:MAG: HAMP domain-containing sensor histidine kinase [Actinomycetota bacterium]|nr:HAMP domain-containing sensor histidine kinase [Actinomycetota bacterium]